MALVDIQRRMRELGRIRFGRKSDKGYPTSLDTLRFTSQNRDVIEAVASLYGGDVHPWESPRGPEWEVVTTVDKVECVVPPQPIDERQWWELWGGKPVELLRRCNGQEQTNGEPCACDPAERECKPTTHVAVMLPDVPGIGVWRFSTRGLNAAAELPDTVELLQRLAAIGKPTPAVVGIARRKSTKDGETHRYVVPYLDIKGTTAQLLASLTPGERVAALTGQVSGAPGDSLPSLPPGAPPTPTVASTTEVREAADVVDVTPDDDDGPDEQATALELLGDHLAMLPADSDTVAVWDGYLRQLFSLMERAGHWPADRDGHDSLHVWLQHYHGVDHVSGLKKAQLIATAKRAHAKATDEVTG